MPEWVNAILKMRQNLRWTARKIASTLELAYSTVTAVLRRHKFNRVRDLEPKPPANRYEHAAPGDLLHMDIKTLPRFDHPGHRVTQNRKQSTRHAGTESVHICIDDHSRWAYVEVLPDETQQTTTRFLKRALAAYKTIGVTAKRLMIMVPPTAHACLIRHSQLRA